MAFRAVPTRFPALWVAPHTGVGHSWTPVCETTHQTGMHHLESAGDCWTKWGMSLRRHMLLLHLLNQSLVSLGFPVPHVNWKSIEMTLVFQQSSPPTHVIVCGVRSQWVLTPMRSQGVLTPMWAKFVYQNQCSGLSGVVTPQGYIHMEQQHQPLLYISPLVTCINHGTG